MVRVDPVAIRQKLFAALDVYRDGNLSHSAALNMAIDEALLESSSRPAIRFYCWDHPALSFGYFGKFADVRSYEARHDLVRRWTGGGIVFHGEDLTYSIVVPVSHPAFGESAVSIYEAVHRAICQALAVQGCEAVVAGVADPAFYKSRTAGRTGISDAGYSQCFKNPVRADVLLNGRKIAGAAQRRTRRGLLQQGSIQNVELDGDFPERLAGALAANIEERTIPSALVSRATEIVNRKYGTEVWLRKR